VVGKVPAGILGGGKGWRKVWQASVSGGEKEGDAPERLAGGRGSPGMAGAVGMR